MKTAPRIFISYAQQDLEQVERLYKRLTRAGFNPFLDQKSTLVGQKWEQSIRRAIRNSDLFLACLSKESVDRRGMIQKELKQALDILQEKLDEDVYLIPVRLCYGLN
jgi:hypothetical protein